MPTLWNWKVEAGCGMDTSLLPILTLCFSSKRAFLYNGFEYDKLLNSLFNINFIYQVSSTTMCTLILLEDLLTMVHK